MFKKIRDAISMLIMLYTLFIAMLGFVELGKDIVQELKYQIRRRTNKNITRYQM